QQQEPADAPKHCPVRPRHKARRTRQSESLAGPSAQPQPPQLQPQPQPQQPSPHQSKRSPPQPQQPRTSTKNRARHPKSSSETPAPHKTKPKPKPKPKSKHKLKPPSDTSAPPPESQSSTMPHPQARPAKKKPAKKSDRQPAAAPQQTNESKIYDPYLTPASLAFGFESGILVRGVLRSNPRNSNDAYVALDESPTAAALRLNPELAGYDVGSGSDIYICGEFHRNRAFNGDVVAVRILSDRQAEHSYRAHRQKDDSRHDRRRAKSQKRLDRMAAKVACLASTSTHPSSLVAAETANNAKNGKSKTPDVYGTVVAILAQNENRSFTGKIGYKTPPDVKKYPRYAKSLGESAVWFRSSNKLSQYMLLDESDIPDELRSKSTKLQCTVTIDSWDACDLYPTAKFGTIIGERGSIDVETKIILEENGVCTDPFSSSVLACLPKSPWSIPASEIARRTDLRTECIFTIDPPTARDLDDAVSCKLLPNGNVMVGVHIADVSYFVRPNTPLDLQARQRATTTYMVQNAIPMLPSLLCEDLCSLNPGVDRLAFSVMWEINPDTAEPVSTWFGRTVINSACKLSYDDAQSIIDGQSFPESVARFQTSTSGHLSEASPERVKEIEKSIFWFYDLSVKMRRRRFESGALSLSSVKLSFELDSSGNPISCQPYPIKDSNRLIEEFMLLANMSVAARITASFPKAALLRRHPPPLNNRLDEICKQLGHAGIEINPASSRDIQESLDNITDPGLRFTIESMLTAPMQRAVYFSTHSIKDPSGFSHYALHVPLYTHFTSPIRRYADIIVHRTLEASLAVHGNHLTSAHPLLPPHYSQYFPSTPASGSLSGDQVEDSELLIPEPDQISQIAHRCNLRKDAAKKAQDASSNLFLVKYLESTLSRTHLPGVLTSAIVTKIKQDGFVVALPLFGIESIIYMDRMADVKGYVQRTDGREWKLDMWSVEPAKLTLIWNALAPKSKNSDQDDLTIMISRLVIDENGQRRAQCVNRTESERCVLELRVFDRVTVCVTPQAQPPSLTVRLAMPRLDK
ncbi:hypothetical protein IW150_005252, partial [Coemansia sp. RSA 2607]